jgi:hypothetical protein
MSKSQPVHDLAGRDVQGPAESDAEADTTPVGDGARGRILLSIMESDWTISHAVVLLPKSYLVRVADYGDKQMAIYFFFDCTHCRRRRRQWRLTFFTPKLTVKK